MRSTPQKSAHKAGWLGLSDIGRFLTCASSQSITSFQALLYSPRTSEQLRAMRSARAYKRNSTLGFHWVIDEKWYLNFRLRSRLMITISYSLATVHFLAYSSRIYVAIVTWYSTSFIFLQTRLLKERHMRSIFDNSVGTRQLWKSPVLGYVQ